MNVNNIKQVKEILGVGNSVAKELLTLSGDDPDLVCDMSLISPGLDQSKANIINARFRRLEDAIRYLREDD